MYNIFFWNVEQLGESNKFYEGTKHINFFFIGATLSTSRKTHTNKKELHV